MKLPAFSQYDPLLQAIIIPLYIGMLNWAFIGNVYWENWTTFGMATGIAIVISFSGWLVNNSIGLRLNQRYPDPRQSVTRISRLTLLCVASSSLHSTLIFGLYTLIHLPSFTPAPSRLSLGLLATLVIVAIVIATYEGIHNFGRWEASRQEIDTLSKAQIQAQLDALRQQVNPHFLFNSLNSLSALIDEDPRQAGAFAEELSSVYRYLLRSNESPLVPLASELDFIQSYYHLLKTRHGDSLTLVTRILPGAETRQLPPLTLQLLIENAVKHNVILPEQPLTIALTADTHQQLIVSNNLQRKPNRGLSNGVGLSNILSKYQMLDQPAPIIEDDGREFRVTLPLV